MGHKKTYGREDPPPGTPATTPVLQRYFRNRTSNLPPRPSPRLRHLMGLVLSAAGSAPSHDNKPYELLHHGARFCATLLAQGQWAACDSPDLLVHILGPNLELLV